MHILRTWSWHVTFKILITWILANVKLGIVQRIGKFVLMHQPSKYVITWII